MEEGWTLVQSRKLKIKPKKQTPVDTIVAILKKYESGLSDGYEHYLHYFPENSNGTHTVESALQHIANEILSAVKRV